MASSMKAYLAAKYMSGPKADAILARTSTSDGAPKKKKRKVAGSSTAPAAGPSIIKDDDLLGWGDEAKEVEEDDSEVVVASDRSFKKRQRTDESSGWATIRESTPPLPEDEKPQIIGGEDMDVDEQPFKGGLLTSKQLKKRLPKAAASKTELTQEEIAAAQETVYRDASGRKVDMAAEKAEAARKKREAEEKEAKKMEWGKGLVQREEQEKRREELQSMRNQQFARTVDDAALNEDMKAQERWNDPAAQFLSVSLVILCYYASADLRNHELQKKKSKGPKKPEYTGPPPPPNRFGIKPGYRWDGVGMLYLDSIAHILVLI
jgi:pre-mRNA-splicing factor CWC26